MKNKDELVQERILELEKEVAYLKGKISVLEIGGYPPCPNYTPSTTTPLIPYTLWC